MTKSWKKLIKPTDSDSINGSENSFSDVQLTLDQIAAQNEELDDLLKERQSLEKEMGNLLHSNNPVTEDPRFSGTIESLKTKREKEKKRAAQKRKLEERLLKKNKELEKWEQNLKRLKEKLALQRKSALAVKKETQQDLSTSLTALKSLKTKSEKRPFDADTIRKKKDEIRRSAASDEKKKVLTEEIKKVKKLPEKIREFKTQSDSFGQKDLAKFQQKLDPEKKTVEIPTRIRRIKDDWDEKRENQKEKLREKTGLKKPKEKLEEVKRFGNSVKSAKSEVVNSLKSMESQAPEMKGFSDKLDKELSFDDRQMNLSENASAKKTEQKQVEEKENSRREKLKERLLSIKKAERKEEERSSRKKERKNEKYT